MRLGIIFGLVTAFGLTGCAELGLGCFSECHRHAQNSTSLVEFLYPNGAAPPTENAQPKLNLPLRVGLAFLPGNESEYAPDAAHKEQLLEEIRRRFISRHFIAEIVLIPDYYLRGKQGFEGLHGVQRLYGVDLMALVSYDQVVHVDDNDWSLGYMTIVGAYVLKGTRHDVSTLIDLAVVDPATHSLVLRAGGTDTRRGNVTLIRENVELRQAATDAFSAATKQMIEHFDGALTQFEADVREGKANVKVVSNRNGESGGGGSGGAGSMDWIMLTVLVPLAVARLLRRQPIQAFCLCAPL